MKEDFDNGETLTREQIGKDYDVELKKIRAGNSIELLRRGESLQRAKKRKIESADAHRKMQIRNINELYDWEIAEAEARYKLAFEEQKERLIIEISSKALEKARIVDEINRERDKNTKRMSTSSSSSSSSSNNDNQPYISDKKVKDNSKNKDKEEKEEIQDPLAEAVAIVNSSSGRVTRNKSGVKRYGTRHSATDTEATLNKALSEKDIRGDFLSIVKDLENRANRNSSVVSLHQMVPVKVNEDAQTIAIGPVPGFKHSISNNSKINDNSNNNSDKDKDGNSASIEHASVLGREVTYPIGSFVLVRSGLSEEEFSGVLTAITVNEVIVRLGTGARIRVYVNQIRDQRVWIRPDTDIEADGNVYKAVASTISSINKAKSGNTKT